MYVYPFIFIRFSLGTRKIKRERKFKKENETYVCYIIMILFFLDFWVLWNNIVQKWWKWAMKWNKHRYPYHMMNFSSPTERHDIFLKTLIIGFTLFPSDFEKILFITLLSSLQSSKLYSFWVITTIGNALLSFLFPFTVFFSLFIQSSLYDPLLSCLRSHSHSFSLSL